MRLASLVADLGRALSKLPLNVRFAKMLLGGVGSGVLDLAIMLVACMSEQSPFLDSFGARAQREKDGAKENGEGEKEKKREGEEQPNSEEAERAKKKAKEEEELRRNR